MEEWKKLLRNSVNERNLKRFAERLNLTQKELEDIKEVTKKYPMRINPYYLSLIKKKRDAIWRQCIPDIRELHDEVGSEDPLHEEIDSPTEGLTHRYPDRVLFLIENQCSMYCRFCTRKRRVGDVNKEICMAQIKKGIGYIKKHKKVRDVVLSGGDPLMLDDEILETILKMLRQIKHVEIIRIGTRMPCSLPQRITKKLCKMLKKYHPLYINTHFNHPAEITPESRKACEMLADAGIPLGNQTVLLRDINDDPETIKKLMQQLLVMRVKPYYLYQADIVRGTDHFRTDIETAMRIMTALRGFTSGMAVPTYVIDVPGGGGKIPVNANYVVKWRAKGKKYDRIVLRNYKGKVYKYPLPKNKNKKLERETVKVKRA